MSPRVSFAVALAGVVLAGLPLLHLTGREAAETPPAVAAARQDAVPVLLALRCTGQPVNLVLRHEGRELPAELVGDGEWEAEHPLPAGRLEVEVEVEWPPEQAATAQAVTLTATPEGGAETAETHWTSAGENKMHCLFTLKGGRP